MYMHAYIHKYIHMVYVYMYTTASLKLSVSAGDARLPTVLQARLASKPKLTEEPRLPCVERKPGMEELAAAIYLHVCVLCIYM